MTSNFSPNRPCLSPLPNNLRCSLAFQKSVAAWLAYRRLSDPGPAPGGAHLHLEVGIQFGAMVMAQALANEEGAAFRHEPKLAETLLLRAEQDATTWPLELRLLLESVEKDALRWVEEFGHGFGGVDSLAEDAATKKIFDAVKTEFLFRYLDQLDGATRTDHTIAFFVELPLPSRVVGKTEDLMKHGFRWDDLIVQQMPALAWKRRTKGGEAKSIDDLLRDSGLFCPSED